MQIAQDHAQAEMGLVPSEADRVRSVMVIAHASSGSDQDAPVRAVMASHVQSGKPGLSVLARKIAKSLR